jgi:hypothetical protein
MMAKIVARSAVWLGDAAEFAAGLAIRRRNRRAERGVPCLSFGR